MTLPRILSDGIKCDWVCSTLLCKSWYCLYLFYVLHHCKNCVILILFVLVSYTTSLRELCDLDTVCTCFMYCITGRIEKSLPMLRSSWSTVDSWLGLYYSSRWHLGRISWYIGKSVKHQVAPCNKFIWCNAALSRRKNDTNYSTKYKPEIVWEKSRALWKLKCLIKNLPCYKMLIGCVWEWKTKT